MTTSVISGPYKECASYNIHNFCGEFPEIIHGGLLTSSILSKKTLSYIEYKRDGVLDTKVSFTKENHNESNGFRVDKLTKIEVFKGKNINTSSSTSKYKSFAFVYGATGIGRLTLKEFWEKSGNTSLDPHLINFPIMVLYRIY